MEGQLYLDRVVSIKILFYSMKYMSKIDTFTDNGKNHTTETSRLLNFSNSFTTVRRGVWRMSLNERVLKTSWKKIVWRQLIQTDELIKLFF